MINGYVEVFGTVLSENFVSIKADCGIDKDVWLPKSQLEDWPDVGESGEILMTEWMAIKKGLI